MGKQGALVHRQADRLDRACCECKDQINEKHDARINLDQNARETEEQQLEVGLWRSKVVGMRLL
jgi:hypothetical protein